jgi:hypothetical protein
MTPHTAMKITALTFAASALIMAHAANAQHSHDHGMSGKGGSRKSPATTAAETDSSVTAHADHVMNGKMVAGLHMEMTPTRPMTPADSIRAAEIVRELRSGIEKYKDVKLAVKDGYRQFAPGLKGQKVLHFTNNRAAIRAAFSFNPARPTSLLYKPVEGGKPILIGAMYTAPKRASLDELDKRVPLSVAQWHRHTNFCVPPRGQKERWTETRNGMPVFGPMSPIATEEECEKVGGRFHPQVFGWMVHANVFASDDPAVIWEHEHSVDGGHKH